MFLEITQRRGKLFFSYCLLSFSLSLTVGSPLLLVLGAFDLTSISSALLQRRPCGCHSGGWVDGVWVKLEGWTGPFVIPYWVWSMKGGCSLQFGERAFSLR
ncbi:hypothetical protein C8Q69DRAFT_64792 [Paecilomyces variotii]|uniref:Uncharacterized protein n=1 Tax=Byssochlamys spectabilis TaxID=264951 RepID=A0A443HN72_BYSSP|nr:hypothetical protein C8Q69DRAFT_64792 [Paecilomyces variotii]RWQ93265.1 hypothetical protein C8Q69DRAFT_64792 [Paecilomyces variotii]